uniref:Putative secreted protein n=1 Tax=Anopheles marajoara TaxID=58244 RepID=A0A2M4C7F8_9DIPT
MAVVPRRCLCVACCGCACTFRWLVLSGWRRRGTGWLRVRVRWGRFVIDWIRSPRRRWGAQCNKKLGVIMIMKCHCEKIFCAQHRYAEAHNCSYDFKLQGRKLLERENPLVVAEKLPKI